MWFIKTEFWDEFQTLLNNLLSESEMTNKVRIIMTAENFCKQGKGISFYSKRVINTKVLKEIEEYKNNKNYQEYNIN